MSPRKLLVFLILINLSVHPDYVSSANVNLDFPFFTFRNITLLGDSYLRNGVIGLTRELGVPSSSSGTVIYNHPVAFFDPETNITASFSTRFSFSIDNVNPSSFGDGLAFFLSPNNQTLGSPGGYLGLVNSSEFSKNRFIAIEFDTKQDLHFNDPDENHVGLDINSLISIKTANSMIRGVNLKSGNLITAWIDYENEKKKFEIFLSYSSFKPEEPLLRVSIDLSDYLKEFMYVGFSASTEGSTELHCIENWSFRTMGFRPIRPKVQPHSVSESSVPLKPPITVSGSGNRHHKRIGLGLGIGFPAFFGAVLVIFGWISVKKWKGTKSERIIKAELVTGPRQFSYKELKSATRGFHSSRILGHGAFGTVYKAFFMDLGTISAVKRSKHTHEGKTEFLSELSIIASLRHKNLVQLQGWCVEKGELLLVYDFMPNGSLDKVLYQESENNNPLKWTYRYYIAVGLASVLTYLHQECEQQVIHRDIKTSNVMLDGNYNARLGDFGLARLMDHGTSPVSTLTAGTMGYLVPEYLQYGTATEKTDVYSYGVVVLELACGRRPIEREDESQKQVNLVDWVWRKYSEGKLIEAADQRMNGEFKEEEMRRLLLIGLSCANPDSSERPSMRRVLQILNNEADPVIVPKVKPSLIFSNSLPLSIDEIVSDCEECSSPGSELEIKVY
ncbi:probable L-type lectin-domain containing receptor kinase S.7 [Olea europaea var. sylvestris]|uniref:non-specific serine/threonine protein kinase n=1 Tax=Olea europaea subsp. europaea TaxID=158383 RepID=A0A8S0R1C9_OLEEU|nr:probable L-type lectin-domain containing receptor kinase S.7 [Olea europaea var. sylvestris]CAA2972198.1 probable L-type lectin-domain containing receptor kinase [Olea europaea subsp. europaea]